MNTRERKTWRQLTAAIALVATLLSAACSSNDDQPYHPSSSSIQLLQDDGATYRAPTSLIGQRGSLLAARAASSGGLLSGADRATLLYQSQNSKGEKVAVSGALLTPKGKAPEGGWPIVSWAHGTVGVADRCAPSRREDMAYASYAQYIKGLLDAGYAVAATDYIGLGTPGQHTYMNAVDQGNAVVDIVTAARQLEPRLSLDKWFAIGHSQGGAAALEATRAGDPKGFPVGLGAAVAIAPGNNLGSALAKMTDGSDSFSLRSAYLAFLLSGLAATDSSFEPGSILSASGKEFLEKAQDLCLFDASADNPAGMRLPSPGSLLSGGGGDQALRDVSRKFAEYGDPDKEAALGPVLVITGDSDLDVPTAGTLAMADHLKKLGSTVEELLVPNTDHDQAVNATLCRQLKFLARNGGVSNATGCAD